MPIGYGQHLTQDLGSVCARLVFLPTTPIFLLFLSPWHPSPRASVGSFLFFSSTTFILFLTEVLVSFKYRYAEAPKDFALKIH